MASKLPPPIINETLPACYIDSNNRANFQIPFIMNRAVKLDNVKQFNIQLKTVQNNNLLKTFTISKSNVNNQIISWSYNKANLPSAFSIGSFFKIQIAYVATDNTEGYYSNVGVIKCTSEPEVSIEGFTSSNNNFPSSECFGIYNSSDTSEQPYSYYFSLYKNNTEIENSGWILHNSEITDSYFFKTVPNSNETYQIQYTVKTLNNLVKSSNKYSCTLSTFSSVPASVFLTIDINNVFEEGYINISLTSNSSNSNYFIELCRSEDNGESWKILNRCTHNKTNYNFKDYTIEQGISYKYAYRFYNNSNQYTAFQASKTIIADFEDMFLSDSKKQIKIRFNPKISSFKTNKLESKIDTIGSKYPFIFKNGIVEYKEFPISGLISYHSDKNKEFTNALEIIFNDQLERTKNPSQSFSEQKVETTNLIDYNIKAERDFKLELFNWLNNGEIKLFKSPTEGNYLVRLLNVSLSPEDKVGRMLHNFSCTAYEVKDFDYKNLIDLGFYNLNT